MPAATRKKKGSPAAADSAETVSEETVPAPEGAEEEIVETELEVSGGTLEVTQLAAAQAVQAKAQESAAAAAEQVKAAKAAKDAADAGLAAAEDQEKAVADKAVQYDKWVAYVEDDSNDDEVQLARYWKLIEREDKKRADAANSAREIRLDSLRRADIVRQDKRDAAQSAQIADLRKELDVLRNGENKDEEPAFRDFAARALDNQYGELRQNDPLKVFQNEPKLQSYDSLSGSGRDTCYDRSAQRAADQMAGSC